MLIQGFKTDDDGRILGLHFPLLRVYDDGSTSYSWPKGFASRWFSNECGGVPHFVIGDSFILFRGRSYENTRRESRKQKKDRIKNLAGFLCRQFPIVPVRKEAL